MQKWKTLTSKLVFDHTWFKVQQDSVQLPDGRILDDYLMWPEGDVVLVVAITKENNIILVRQYKHAADEIMIEVPAGYINKDEKPEDGARRELQEETGYTTDELTSLGHVTNNPTKIIGTIHLFLAQNVTKTHDTQFDENEDIEVLVKSSQEIIGMITRGEIWVTGTISALFLAFQKLKLM